MEIERKVAAVDKHALEEEVKRLKEEIANLQKQQDFGTTCNNCGTNKSNFKTKKIIVRNANQVYNHNFDSSNYQHPSAINTGSSKRINCSYMHYFTCFLLSLQFFS